MEEQGMSWGDMDGFSDHEDFDHLGNSPKNSPSSPSANMDFMASLLQTSSSTDKEKKKKEKKILVRRNEEEVDNKNSSLSVMKERMEEMERELQMLREKMKSSETSQPSSSLVPSSSHTPSSRALSIKGEKAPGKSSNSLKKAKGIKPSQPHPPMEPDRDNAARLVAQRNEDKAAGVVTERYSGLRIKNPLISSELMKERMKGRKVIKIKNVGSSIIDGDIPGDWVLTGVVVDKLPPREDRKGKKYVIWKLSDLSSQDAIISLFLFGVAYQNHWKTSVGTVVAILNPDIVPNKEGGVTASKKSSVAVSISNDKKMMLMGVSQDYTICRGVTKAGKKCSNFASISDGGYCDYHINKAYDRSRSSRMELQSGYGPSVNRGKLKEKLFNKSKTEYFYYGGETFAVAPNSREASKSGESGSSRLFAPGAKVSAAKLVADLKRPLSAPNTVPVPGIAPAGKDGLQKLCTKTKTNQLAKKSNSLGRRMLESTRKKEEHPKESKAVKPLQLTASEMLRDYREVQPCLGRGCGPGELVDLTDSTGTVSAAKRKAAAVLRRSKVDSQELKKKRLLDRVQQSRGTDQAEEDDDSESPEKRPRISNLDIDKILNAKSSHSWLSDQADLERECEYFDRLEKKENIEAKKERVTQLTVSAVHCKKCNYTAEAPSELCNKQGHHISRVKAIKKAFVCSNCNQKTFEYDVRWPVAPCGRCGSSKYNPTSMYYIKKGPTLPSEELLLRGVEEKFLS